MHQAVSFLKANINQFCIVNWPLAMSNTHCVFGMDGCAAALSKLLMITEKRVAGYIVSHTCLWCVSWCVSFSNT